MGGSLPPFGDSDTIRVTDGPGRRRMGDLGEQVRPVVGSLPPSVTRILSESRTAADGRSRRSHLATR